MKTTKMLLATILCLLSGATAIADDGKLASWSYAEIQGGLAFTSTNANITKLIKPQAAVSYGHYFSPVVGARLHVSGWETKGRFESLNADYAWKYFTGSADLLFNLTNLISKDPDNHHLLNIILIGGVGLANEMDNGELTSLVASGADVDVPLMWHKNRLSHNIRCGARVETDMTKKLGVSVELNANSLSDRWNSKTNDSDDWMIAALIGVSYRFGQKYCRCHKPEPQPEPVEEPQPEPVEEPQPEPVEEPQPVVKEPETIHETIFYLIRQSDPEVDGKEQMARVADFMKRNPESKVIIVGYADKGTGNYKLNRMYSEKRAAYCKDVLVNKYGCDASRISTDYKGDTVQPFEENDKNRVTIIDGK